MNKLIVLSGVPGSGKSYFSKTIKKLKDSHVYVVSSDEIRALIAGKQSDVNHEELVWKMFYSLARSYALDKDGIVILDATHVTSELRVDRNTGLKPLFDEVDLVLWNSDKNMVMNQNFQRDYPVPVEAMEMFFNMFELPTENDRQFFDKIIIVENHDIAPAIAAIKLNENDE